MADDRQWFCMRCLKHHDIVDGVVQCDAGPWKPLTPEQIRAALDWASTHDIEISKER
jgi:hypothetical protein